MQSLRTYYLVKRRGYTLVELVIVVMIIGVLAATAAPKFVNSLAATRADAAARRIVADLKLVRSRAGMTSRSEGESISFFPATDNYQMISDPDPNRPGQEYWVHFSSTSYPVDLVSVQFTNSLGISDYSLITFDMYGRAQCGFPTSAPMVFSQIIVASGNQQRTVVIDPITGVPRVN